MYLYDSSTPAANHVIGLLRLSAIECGEITYPGVSAEEGDIFQICYTQEETNLPQKLSPPSSFDRCVALSGGLYQKLFYDVPLTKTDRVFDELCACMCQMPLFAHIESNIYEKPLLV